MCGRKNGKVFIENNTTTNENFLSVDIKKTITFDIIAISQKLTFSTFNI
jgi:hypothetical protein